MSYLITNVEGDRQVIYELHPGENTIGRGKTNSIVFNDISISREHAKVIITTTEARIQDLNSHNHTFVNGQKINQCELKDGDLIRCGSIIFHFVHKPDTSTPSARQEEAFDLSIVSRLATEKTRFEMQDLLNQDSAQNPGTIIRLRQQQGEQRALDKLKILLEVGKQLSSPEEPHILLEKILDLLFKIMRVDRAAILLVNEETKQLEYSTAKFRSGISTDKQFYSKKIANFVYESGDAILTTDARIDQRFNPSPLDSILKQAIHASMCVPLKPREEVIGVLYADNLSMVNIYSEEDLEFLTCLANQAAIALDNAQLYKKMQAEAVMRSKLELFFPQAVSKKLKEDGNLEIIETEVTALFSDLSNFTSMSSQMSPREVIEMLNDYFKVMVEEIVFEYEGTLEKYIGDALLAIWGAPYQKPDDPERAVKAAIEMQWAVRKLNKEWSKQRNLEIEIHVGLNTGKVAAGNIGSPRLIQYAAIGDTTNVTSRICSAAQAGEILISQSTFEKLSDRNLPIEPISPVWVKGKDQPLQLYRVLWQEANRF